MFQSLEYKHPKFYQVFRLFIVFFASLLYAWNLRCFAKTAGLFPGGFSGLSLLLQQIGLDFIHVSIPFSVFNIGLNLVPTYIAYKFCDFDADTAKKLYQAIYEDAADQKLQKYNLTNALKDPEETGEYSSASISLDYYHASADWKNVYDRIDDYYGNTGESVETPTTYGGSAYISFGKDCTHIIQTLIDCGVITDVSDIQFQRPEEKTSQ